jgi:cysteinyl-tRNA synthetase
MSLQVYNTLSKQKELFKSINKKQVNFYVCGVTVYDFCHIGHARAYVVFDTIRRYLEYSGYKVNYIQNFTDIDDKIIMRANELGIDYKVLTKNNIDAYFEDMGKLNIIKATKYPLATEYISQMQKMVESLIAKGYAYVDDGDVWFSVDKFNDYGKLSKKVISELQAGQRVEVNEKKKNPFDFVLWKKAKIGEPSWDSPWGFGRPGWHLECSVMALTELGDTIDIHGGGEDLIFPHHENEIAQSESYTGKKFVNYWLHNGFVNINEEKMSKSKKNFFTIREILKKYDGEVLRFFLQKAHYRMPLNFTFAGLEEAKTALDKLHNTLKNVPENEEKLKEEKIKDEFDRLEKKFFEGMDDDFNFTQSIGVLFEINKQVNIEKCGSSILRRLGNVLGLMQNKEEQKEVLSADIEELISKRTEAKKNKNFALADEIRQNLANIGIIIEDTPNGIRWKKVN